MCRDRAWCLDSGATLTSATVCQWNVSVRNFFCSACHKNEIISNRNNIILYRFCSFHYFKSKISVQFGPEWSHFLSRVQYFSLLLLLKIRHGESTARAFCTDDFFWTSFFYRIESRAGIVPKLFQIWVQVIKFFYLCASAVFGDNLFLLADKLRSFKINFVV